MALQVEPRSSSSIAGLPICWQDATKPPELEREHWIDFFEVALKAKVIFRLPNLQKLQAPKTKVSWEIWRRQQQ